MRVELKVLDEVITGRSEEKSKHPLLGLSKKEVSTSFRPAKGGRDSTALNLTNSNTSCHPERNEVKSKGEL
jgi:hypothetical protein